MKIDLLTKTWVSIKMTNYIRMAKFLILRSIYRRGYVWFGKKYFLAQRELSTLIAKAIVP